MVTFAKRDVVCCLEIASAAIAQDDVSDQQLLYSQKPVAVSTYDYHLYYPPILTTHLPSSRTVVQWVADTMGSSDGFYKKSICLPKNLAHRR